jgi:site-specific DNA-methyltransferase (adenine-specific)
MTTIVKDSYTLMLGDCLERMREIPDGSVDMVLADLPYGTTACKWDIVIPFAPLWEQYWRVLKADGAVVLFGNQPFTTKLIESQLDAFRYLWIWDKVKPSSALHAKKQPLRSHEEVVVFYRKAPTYNPQMQPAAKRTFTNQTYNNGEAFGGKDVSRSFDNGGLKYPKSILTFSNANQVGKVHPTQKPVSILEYLVRTYTDGGETVLDNTMGSGSTGVAAIQAGRRFVGVEKEPAYFEIATERLSLAQSAGTTSDSMQSPAAPDDSEPSAHDVSAVPGSC